MKNYPSKLGTVIAIREQTSRLSRPSPLFTPYNKRNY